MYQSYSNFNVKYFITYQPKISLGFQYQDQHRAGMKVLKRTQDQVGTKFLKKVPNTPQDQLVMVKSGYKTNTGGPPYFG